MRFMMLTDSHHLHFRTQAEYFISVLTQDRECNCFYDFSLEIFYPISVVSSKSLQVLSKKSRRMHAQRSNNNTDTKTSSNLCVNSTCTWGITVVKE